MTTDLMEVYALEVDDQIMFQGAIYRILDIEDGENLDYRLVVADEEGYRRSIEADHGAQFRMICDTDHLADA